MDAPKFSHADKPMFCGDDLLHLADTFEARTKAAGRPPTHGLCGVCGFLAPLDDDGNVTGHLQIRIRRGPNGPEEYRTRFDCDGGGQQPEAVA